MNRFADAAKPVPALQVLHSLRNCWETVTFFAMFSNVWMVSKKIHFINNGLQRCLFFRHFSEMGRKQRKNQDAGKLSPNLSTGLVDLFSLETKSRRLQPPSKNHIPWT
ncbi:MAG: hypothetical protein ACU0BK_17280 [Shimia sp.]|uniref:hypothetical protein n=1 Tax=Shimia sp. TaxID=1954381 RepID=UPI00405A05F4